MPDDVTQSDIDAINARIHDLSTRARSLTAEMRSRKRKAIQAWLAGSYYAFVLIARGCADKFGLWRGGIVIFLPMIAGVAVFIGIDVATSQLSLSILSGVACGVCSLTTAYALLFRHDAGEARRKHEECYAALPRLNHQADAICRQREQIAAEITRAETRRHALIERIEHLQKVRSDEYQRSKLFDRNWRAMRSVEFEYYLEEVFRLLGYEIETTATTGDQGVDLIAVKTGKRIAIQVKGYLNSVSNSAIQEAYAGMAHYRCQHCAVITNSRFTAGAIELAQSTGCILIHEDNFREFVMGHLDLVTMTRGTVE